MINAFNDLPMSHFKKWADYNGYETTEELYEFMRLIRHGYYGVGKNGEIIIIECNEDDEL